MISCFVQNAKVKSLKISILFIQNGDFGSGYTYSSSSSYDDTDDDGYYSDDGGGGDDDDVLGDTAYDIETDVGLRTWDHRCHKSLCPVV